MNYYRQLASDNYDYERQHLRIVEELKKRNVNAFILDDGKQVILKIPEAELEKLPKDEKYNEHYLPLSDDNGFSIFPYKKYDEIKDGWVEVSSYK